MSGVYLDYNAGAPLRPQARAAALEAMEAGGNASSAHRAGRAARQRLETARRQVAALVGCQPDEVVFTSGGAEANSLALGLAGGLGGVLSSVLDHPTLFEAAERAPVRFESLAARRSGRIDLEALERRLSCGSHPPSLIAVTAASHETGVIQPLKEIAELAQRAGARLHVDATAMIGKAPLRFHELGADSLSLSAHKFGGLAGAGALIVREGAPVRPAIIGGGQERGLRAGTENLAGIAAMGAAAEAALATLEQAAASPAAAAARRAEARLQAAGILIIGDDEPRLPQVVCAATPGVPAVLQVMALDLEGVMISAGAACSSGKLAPSRALQAMGLGELASCAVRASGGWATSAEHWERFADALIETARRRRARARPEEFV